MKEVLFTKTFWKRTTDRVVSTGAQYALGFIGAGTVLATTIDWKSLIIGTLLAALLSLLKALAGTKIGNNSADPGWTSTTEEDKNVDEQNTQGKAGFAESQQTDEDSEQRDPDRAL